MDASFVATSCLFCQNKADRVIYPARLNAASFTGYAYSARRTRRREHYRIVACRNCGLVRSDPIIREEQLRTLYAESQFIFSAEAPYAARTYGSLLQKLRARAAGQITSLLEIGCSTGFFLAEALQLGVPEVVGFEPSRDCYRHAPEHLQAHIINDVYTPELVAGRRFDVICGFHVFDHLRDPLGVLRSLTEHLNPGGYVLIVCHDAASWSAKLLGGYNPIFDVEHIYLFSGQTLPLLLERAGLRCVAIGSLANTYPLGYWLRMLPGAGQLAAVMPDVVRRLPVTFKPGNLYIWGQKGGAPC